jgi:putative metallohydrolase (TIGR04338 family)
MPRDTQKRRVYKCDPAVVALAKPLPTVRDVERFVKRVWSMQRVRDAYPRAVQGSRLPPTVGDGRGRRNAGGHWGGILIPLWARNEAIVLHELAHTICIRQHGFTAAGHGWQFASIYLKLVLYGMGREAHDALKAAFKLHRVKFTAPRKSKPLDPERKAACINNLLIARLKRAMTRTVELDITPWRTTP